MSKKHIEPSKPSPLVGRLAAWLTGVTLMMSSLLLIAQPADAADVVVYKSPTCGCCKNWISHLQENGFSVEVHNERNMSPIKSKLGVPRHLQSCHTATVGGMWSKGTYPPKKLHGC